MKKILVVMTGGTICSVENGNGELCSDVSRIHIEETFKKGGSVYADNVEFDKKALLNTLSENMTLTDWNTLIELFKNTATEKYSGIIVLHGTDTLAYTSALLSAALSGYPLPIIMVSSHSPLDDIKTNGHANFKAAVELIMNGIAPNVYVVYENTDKEIYLHTGDRIRQCANFSNDFFSDTSIKIDNRKNAQSEGVEWGDRDRAYERIGTLNSCVLLMFPYPAMDYRRISLDGVCAVIHGTYHSESVCVKGEGTSLTDFTNICSERNIPVILAPCSKEAYKYESTGNALRAGAFESGGITLEYAYGRALVGCALGNNGKDLVEYIGAGLK